MQKGGGNIGSKKHGQSGKPHNNKHFTGKSKGKPTRRKGLTRKQRKAKRRTHKNKYKRQKGQ